MNSKHQPLLNLIKASEKRNQDSVKCKYYSQHKSAIMHSVCFAGKQNVRPN